MEKEQEKIIRGFVKMGMQSYAAGFSDRHISQKDDPDGTINMKIHNVFISALGSDIQYYASLVRSLDRSHGNKLERMAITIPEQYFEVYKSVEADLYEQQINFTEQLLETYKTHKQKPKIEDYAKNIVKVTDSGKKSARHDSDYYLIDKDTNSHYLIELKIGGDLDNKKARSEKEALLEQYFILKNKIGSDKKLKIYFATAYNRFGEENDWNQGRVLQFFSKDELLIGKDFWNFICKSSRGYEVVIDEYRKNANIIMEALSKIKSVYLDE